MIESGSFAELRGLEEVTFEAGSSVRELGGFEGCGVRSILVPSSVEIIRKNAFRACTSLRSVSFEEPSNLVEIHGFSDCSFAAFAIPSSVTCIGPHAFAHADMPLVTFESTSLKKITGFQQAALCVFRFLAPPTCSIAFLRVFIEYPIEILFSRRRLTIPESHAELPSTKPDLRVAVSSPFHDLREVWRADCPDPSFTSSLFISLRISDALSFALPAGKSGHTRYFRSVGAEGQSSSQPEKSPPTVPLDSVIAMFSFPNLLCEDHSKSHLGRQLIFHVFYEICGSDSDVLVKCPPSASAFPVSTQRCCSHFVIGKGSPRDRRSGDMIVTRPQIAQGCAYAASHPIRVIARVLVRANQLKPHPQNLS
jgi:hypothetical protein